MNKEFQTLINDLKKQKEDGEKVENNIIARIADGIVRLMIKEMPENKRLGLKYSKYDIRKEPFNYTYGHNILPKVINMLKETYTQFEEVFEIEQLSADVLWLRWK